MTNEEIIKQVHPDFYTHIGGAHVRRHILIESEAYSVMNLAREDEAKSFSIFLRDYTPVQNGWIKNYTDINVKVKVYGFEELYREFKKQNT